FLGGQAWVCVRGWVFVCVHVWVYVPIRCEGKNALSHNCSLLCAQYSMSLPFFFPVCNWWRNGCHDTAMTPAWVNYGYEQFYHLTLLLPHQLLTHGLLFLHFSYAAPHHLCHAI